jgi:hypothetical protein
MEDSESLRALLGGSRRTSAGSDRGQGNCPKRLVGAHLPKQLTYIRP